MLTYYSTLLYSKLSKVTNMRTCTALLLAVNKSLTTGANVNLLKSAFVCIAIAVICGCDQGQPTPPPPTPPAPTPDKQATSAVTAADFAATKKDAESGDATAQYNLGVMYQAGRGVPQDDAEAVKWTRLAADQGDANAQTSLGVMYYFGEGVPQDYAEAVKWFRLAADQGYTVAQENLGFMYRDGQGVPQDDVETYAWFSVAAGDRFPNAAKGRDLTASKLTPEQLSQGQKRATELLEKISGGK